MGSEKRRFSRNSLSEFSNLSSLKLLQSVDLLSRLTILQLSHLVETLSEVSFSAGQMIVDMNEGLTALYIIQMGQVRITFDTDLLSNQNVCSLKYEYNNKDDNTYNSRELSVEKTEGSYSGEWTLLDEHMGSLSAVAVDDVVCAILTKEKFDLVVGHFTKFSRDDRKSKDYSSNIPKEPARSIDISTLAKVNLTDMVTNPVLVAEWEILSNTEK